MVWELLIIIFGCFLKWWVFPNLHPKCWSFLVGKTPWLLGKPTSYIRKPPIGMALPWIFSLPRPGFGLAFLVASGVARDYPVPWRFQGWNLLKRLKTTPPEAGEFQDFSIVFFEIFFVFCDPGHLFFFRFIKTQVDMSTFLRRSKAEILSK